MCIQNYFRAVYLNPLFLYNYSVYQNCPYNKLNCKQGRAMDKKIKTTKIKPTFNKKYQKGTLKNIDAQTDFEFKSEHPAAYRFLVFFGVVALIIPIALFFVFTSMIFPASDSEWVILGFLGSISIGIGLFSVVSAWLNQYLGHLVTGLCFSAGAVLILASCLLMYA